MIEVTNRASFTEQCKRIMTNKIKPHIDLARDKGYIETIKASPEATGITLDHLRKTTKTSKGQSLYLKGIRFDGLDEGRKDALSKMQTGYYGGVATDTPAMQEWLKAIGQSHWNSSWLIVGRNSRSRFYGGDKNPMQFGKAKMKEMIEKNLRVQFK